MWCPPDNVFHLFLPQMKPVGSFRLRGALSQQGGTSQSVEELLFHQFSPHHGLHPSDEWVPAQTGEATEYTQTEWRE